MTKADLKAAQEERAHCLRLIEAPIPGLEELAKMSGDRRGLVKEHITALREAATAVRESGEFRDAMAIKRYGIG